MAVLGCIAPGGAPLASEWTMADTGITLSSPGDAVPSVSSDAAYAQCLTGAAACDHSSPTSIQLALATDPGSGQLDANGNLRLTLDNTLVWAITWLGIPCPPSSGGPYRESAIPSTLNSPAATPRLLCDEVAFVDARSGTFYFTVTGPHG